MREMKANTGIALCVGLVLGAALFGRSSLGTAPAAAAPAAKEIVEDDSTRMQARVAMIAVDYHASNLWFAGKAQNWPLADYYWKQTLNHVRLSSQVKGTPDREGQPGNQAKLAEIAEAIEKAPSVQIGATIQRKDLQQFAFAYRALLENCYACHKAAGLPFLRPRIPAPPASSLITVDANAPWPK